MAKELILIGGGGHCVSCIDVIEAQGCFKIAGILDVPKKIGQDVLGYPIIASDEELIKFVRAGKLFIVTVGHVGKINRRVAVFEKLDRLAAKMAVVQSPFAHVSNHADVGSGSMIMHHALVNANAKIGSNVIINTKALIEHDVQIGHHSHIATGAVVNGGCVIGENVFVGSNSVIKEGVRIAPHVVIGAGAVVIESITRQGTYVGNPCQRTKSK